ncbi:MAG: hypothetical protein SOV43_08090 [Selenomonadaceae bacterium]|nr:hypothetical protein [Selenomonadaceae bacterium]
MPFLKKQALIAAILAATTVTAVSATPAFAKTANPFKDLPADQWAYDAVTMLG